MKIMILDTETTNKKPGQIVQLSYALMNTDTGDIKFVNRIFKVKSMAQEAEAVHGISVARAEELSGGKVFADYAKTFYKHLQWCDTFVAYNGNFDIRFIKAEFTRIGVRMPILNFVDVLPPAHKAVYLPPTVGNKRWAINQNGGYNWNQLNKLGEDELDDIIKDKGIEVEGKNPKLTEALEGLGMTSQDVVRNLQAFTDDEVSAHDARFDIMATIMVSHKLNLFPNEDVSQFFTPEDIQSDHGRHLHQAKGVAEHSTCLRRHYGAVIVDQSNEVIGYGFSSPPKGVATCTTCIRVEQDIPRGTRYEVCKSVHAEQNAILTAMKLNYSTEGSTLYLIGLEPNGDYTKDMQPCCICKRLIIQAGIKEVVTRTQYGKIKITQVQEWIDNPSCLTEGY